MATMKNKETARKMSIDAGKFNEMMEMIHTEHHRLKGENEDLKIENEKLKEKYEWGTSKIKAGVRVNPDSGLTPLVFCISWAR